MAHSKTIFEISHKVALRYAVGWTSCQKLSWSPMWPFDLAFSLFPVSVAHSEFNPPLVTPANVFHSCGIPDNTASRDSPSTIPLFILTLEVDPADMFPRLLRPWLRRDFLQEDIQLGVPSTKSRRVQLITFLSHRTASQIDVDITVQVSDTQHWIPAVFSLACTEAFERQQASLTSISGALINLRAYTMLAYRPRSGQPTYCYLSITQFDYMGSDDCITIGNPSLFNEDQSIALLVKQLSATLQPNETDSRITEALENFDQESNDWNYLTARSVPLTQHWVNGDSRTNLDSPQPHAVPPRIAISKDLSMSQDGEIHVIFSMTFVPSPLGSPRLNECAIPDEAEIILNTIPGWEEGSGALDIDYYTQLDQQLSQSVSQPAKGSSSENLFQEVPCGQRKTRLGGSPPLTMDRLLSTEHSIFPNISQLSPLPTYTTQYSTSLTEDVGPAIADEPPPFIRHITVQIMASHTEPNSQDSAWGYPYSSLNPDFVHQSESDSSTEDPLDAEYAGSPSLFSPLTESDPTYRLLVEKLAKDRSLRGLGDDDDDDYDDNRGGGLSDHGVGTQSGADPTFGIEDQSYQLATPETPLSSSPTSSTDTWVSQSQVQVVSVSLAMLQNLQANKANCHSLLSNPDLAGSNQLLTP
ncbi:hypothetical protein BJ085DRAFT_32148 [Dimargaris cristalligena]|uniref:Shelterin complex subunit TPP1/Est3 domain-containing protein n=1 Tax=Dimargaris cristalligena TaxID=215637 RepID=A0A4P9ZQV8_9FUNG|nr:hypothetical protein BJ085DRAFT_32148 [Dimargaris cristalligena]|eukprot:RKP35705.1 hypothetical protein BJ085DRAFT_32148 [Dimargaris cristalligena]